MDPSEYAKHVQHFSAGNTCQECPVPQGRLSRNNTDSAAAGLKQTHREPSTEVLGYCRLSLWDTLKETVLRLALPPRSWVKTCPIDWQLTRRYAGSMKEDRFGPEGAGRRRLGLRPSGLYPDIASLVFFSGLVALFRPDPNGFASPFYLGYGVAAAAWIQLRLLPLLARIAERCASIKKADGPSLADARFPHALLLTHAAVALITSLGPMEFYFLLTGRPRYGWGSDTYLTTVSFFAAHNVTLLSLIGVQWFFIRCHQGFVSLLPLEVTMRAIAFAFLSVAAYVAGAVVLLIVRLGNSPEVPTIALTVGLLIVLALQYRGAVRVWE